jgi:hypothetical protein
MVINYNGYGFFLKRLIDMVNEKAGKRWWLPG